MPPPCNRLVCDLWHSLHYHHHLRSTLYPHLPGTFYPLPPAPYFVLPNSLPDALRLVWFWCCASLFWAPIGTFFLPHLKNIVTDLDPTPPCLPPTTLCLPTTPYLPLPTTTHLPTTHIYLLWTGGNYLPTCLPTPRTPHATPLPTPLPAPPTGLHLLLHVHLPPFPSSDGRCLTLDRFDFLLHLCFYFGWWFSWRWTILGLVDFIYFILLHLLILHHHPPLLTFTVTLPYLPTYL